jgi:hypothetical protein
MPKIDGEVDFEIEAWSPLNRVYGKQRGEPSAQCTHGGELMSKNRKLAIGIFAGVGFLVSILLLYIWDFLNFAAFD